MASKKILRTISQSGSCQPLKNAFVGKSYLLVHLWSFHYIISIYSYEQLYTHKTFLNLSSFTFAWSHSCGRHRRRRRGEGERVIYIPKRSLEKPLSDPNLLLVIFHHGANTAQCTHTHTHTRWWWWYNLYIIVWHVLYSTQIPYIIVLVVSIQT